MVTSAQVSVKDKDVSEMSWEKTQNAREEDEDSKSRESNI